MTPGTYTFGFIPAADPLPARATLPPIRRLECGDVAAVVGSVPEGPLAEQLRAHAEVVQQLMDACGAVLPARFGGVVADDAAVVGEMRRRLPELRTALDAVAGRAEMAVRAWWTGDETVGEPEVGGGPGRAWLARRARDLAAADRLRAAVHDTLRQWAARARWRSPTTPGDPGRGAYLVSLDEVAAFVDAVDRLDARADLRLTRTGPWPPYSFTEPESREVADVRA